METKRLPYHKSIGSVEFGSMKLGNVFSQTRNGAMAHIPAPFGFFPVMLHLLKTKSSSWIKTRLPIKTFPLRQEWIDNQPASPQGRSLNLAENYTYVQQEKPPVSWDQAEELTKTGYWKFDCSTRKFNCTSNTLKLVNKQGNPEEMDFNSLIAGFNEVDKISLTGNWQQLVYQGQEFEYNACLTGQSGNKWLKIKGKVAAGHTGPGNIIGYFQDITEFKELENSLTAAKKNAEAQLQAKSDFLSVLTHEIRTPLNAISGFTYLLLQEDVSREEQKEYLRSILFSTQNLLVLINKTLDYSKIEAGMVEFEQISFQLHELLTDIYRSFYLQAAEKKVHITLDINPATPLIALGDPAKLCQILNNLISNAVKFTREGYIKIAVDVVYESETDWVLEMAVSDTGVGIPLEKQPLIFENYTQANAAVHRQFGGTGLGLAITKKLIELQQGSIHLKSVPGEGSEFLVRLKLAKPDAAHLAVHCPDIHLNQFAGLQGAKILVVDDNALNRNVACKLLTNWQVKTDTAENGLEALNKVRAVAYDIILMDLFMPVMDGFEAIVQIKSAGITTPIIALTGSGMTDDENKLMDLGVRDYVTKPFNPQDFYKTILEQLILTTA